MPERRRFNFLDLPQLRDEIERLQLSLPVDENLSILGDSVAIGELATPNRFVAHPMEGFDSVDDGGPGELCYRRYHRYAAGGTGLIWFEATAVLHEARSNPRQLWLNADNVDNFARLVATTKSLARERHGHDILMVAQLTHSGRYSKPTGTPAPLIAHRSPILDPLHKLADDYPVVTDEYLDRLQDTFVEAAKLAARAGFDGVDLKSCHRYLMSELLASYTRDGKYGGSFENRTRLLRETLARIRQEVPEVFVTTRMNVYDAIPHPYGFGVDENDLETPDLREPIELVGRLKALGAPLINISIGNPYYNPHYGRPYDRPIAGVKPPADDPLLGVDRFVRITRQIQEAHPELPVVAGGYTWLRHLMPYVAAGSIRTGGATLIGQGRGMFAYPESVDDILKQGAMDPNKACVTCSGCTQIMRDGAMTGCVVRDSEIYAEQYKLGRRFALDRLKAEAERCRQCAFPTCQSGCPACVDVPRFLKAFVEDDIATAYHALRERNILPEMCGYVCPSEVQCEGGCVERIFSSCALPIRDIQLVVCQIARRQGLVGVRIPEASTGQSIAVVGGGPAGVACAVKLLEQGHNVTIYEKHDRLGGTPDTLIPGYRFGGAGIEIDAILQPAVDAKRLERRFDVTFGADVTLDQLRVSHNAVFLAIGLGESTSLGEADGVIDALTFLEEAKSGARERIDGGVAVLGGGNTAMDAAVIAKQLGARDVYIVYRRSFMEMPAWDPERNHAIEAGCHFLVLTQPLGYETNAEGRLVGLKVARTELGEADGSGRRSPHAIDGTEIVLPVALVVEAIGQGVSRSLGASLQGVELTDRGYVQTRDGSQATTLDGVFAGGDLVNGGTTAVQAIAEGMRAADEINDSLNVKS